MTVARIQSLLAELKQLLTKHSVEPWASCVADLEMRLREALALNKEWAIRAAFADVERLLHEGKRSFRNVVIRKDLGDCVDANEEAAANARLNLLRIQLDEAIATDSVSFASDKNYITT